MTHTKTIRFLDLFFSAILLFASLPVIFIVIAMIYLDDGRPFFYVQKRVGIGCRDFNIYKFRTMYVSGDDSYEPSVSRLLRVGFFLRRASIDEIPQLLNIVRGDMSFVGPRPLPREILSTLPNAVQEKRATIRPGLVGDAQLAYNGQRRSLVEKVSLDFVLIDRLTVGYYLKLIFFSFFFVFKKIFLNRDAIT